MSKKAATKGELLAQVNLSIRDLAAGSDSAAPIDWEFFCECGAPDCRQQLKLTLDAYGAIHDNGFAVLAPGHRVNQPARAGRLRQEAQALRAQAEHQLKRATRNLAGAKAAAGVVYVRHEGTLLALGGDYARKLASSNPKCALAVDIFARLAAGSPEPVDLDLPGYAADARAALDAVSPPSGDTPQAVAFRAVLG